MCCRVRYLPLPPIGDNVLYMGLWDVKLIMSNSSMVSSTTLQPAVCRHLFSLLNGCIRVDEQCPGLPSLLNLFRFGANYFPSGPTPRRAVCYLSTDKWVNKIHVMNMLRSIRKEIMRTWASKMAYDVLTGQNGVSWNFFCFRLPFYSLIKWQPHLVVQLLLLENNHSTTACVRAQIPYIVKNSRKPDSLPAGLIINRRLLSFSFSYNTVLYLLLLIFYLCQFIQALYGLTANCV